MTTRFLIVFIVVLVFGCGEQPLSSADAGGDVLPEQDGCEWIPMASSDNAAFAERLAEVQKTCDVYPWIEVLKLGPTDAGQAAGYTFPNASWKRSYSMLIREFALVAFDRYTLLPDDEHFIDMPVDVSWEIDKVKNASIPMLSRAVLGDVEFGWHGFAEGLYLPKNKEIDFDVTTRNASGGGASVYLLARGYRLYPKGTISPVQLSVDEHKENGMRLVPFTYGTRITVESLDTKFTSKILISDDFLATGIRTSATGHGDDSVLHSGNLGIGNDGYGLEMRVQSDRLLMSAPASRMAVAGPAPANEWLWDHPVTLPAGGELEVEVSFPMGDQWAFTEDFELEVIVHGYKLERVR